MMSGAHTRSRLLGGLSAAAVAASLVGLAGPVAGARAATAPPAFTLPAFTLPPVLLTFVPPKVGPIRVDIGPTIIDGKVINPGLHVLMPGISLPPITWSFPPAPAAVHA
jgi:hypothetical protein